MKKEIKFIGLVPAYNPDKKFINVIDRLRDKNIDIVVVDDGSKIECDELFEYAHEYGHVIHHDTNQGKGVAIKTGLTYIKENYEGEYIVVTLDCDGQHKIKDAMKLFEANKNDLSSMYIGSRKFSGNVPFRSKFGNTLTRLIYKIVSGVNVYDTQSGLRSFSNELIDLMLDIDGERYEYEINVLLELARRNIDMKEIEIETIYIDDNKGSHFNPLKDSFKIYKEIFKFSMSSIISFIIDFCFYSIFIFLFSKFKYVVQISNVLARLISSSLNYTLNRKMVFKCRNDLTKSIGLYCLLAFSILIVNTILLSLFVGLGMNNIISKLLVEALLFIISYYVQHKFIFKK